MPALSSAARKFAFTQTAADMARVAIALERYRLAKEISGQFWVLAPQFIEERFSMMLSTADRCNIGWKQTGGSPFIQSAGMNKMMEAKLITDDGHNGWNNFKL